MPRPISEKQRAACQKNAQISTGPRTPEGKNKARLNAVKHGLTAKLPLLPFEKPEEFAALRDGFLQDFAPQNTYQTFLVTQLATHAWRILRSQHVEIGLQELALKQVIHDLHSQGLDTEKALAENPYAGLAIALQSLPGDPQNHTFRNFFRYARQIQSDFHRTERALKASLKAKESTTPRSVSSPPPAKPPTLKQQCSPGPITSPKAPPPSAPTGSERRSPSSASPWASPPSSPS